MSDKFHYTSLIKYILIINNNSIRSLFITNIKLVSYKEKSNIEYRKNNRSLLIFINFVF